MRIQHQPPLHLTYGLNIHPGERWDENFEAIRTKASAVREKVSPGKPFGLGLRIGGHAAGELLKPGRVAELKSYLAEHQLYAFTMNGFPWGHFHGQRVKELVYSPDWRTRERLTYTLQLADILAELLPEDTVGSISTVPGAYRMSLKWTGDADAIVGNLLEAVQHLHRIYTTRGKCIQLALEPEPSCMMETTDEFIQFATRQLLPAAGSRGISEEAVLRHIGMCFDTCHMAIQYENLINSMDKCREEGIQIAKIQLSSALKTGASPESLDALKPFVEPVYLHQVKARAKDGHFRSWLDLDSALRALPTERDIEELRIHFHVPLFWQGAGALRSTSDALTSDFFDTVRSGATTHLEIETYTFDVLPPDLKTGDVVDAIAREFQWVLERISP